MNDKIISNKQQGGITAKNVNIGNNASFTETTNKKENATLKNIFWWVFGIAGLIGVIFAILAYFK